VTVVAFCVMAIAGLVLSGSLSALVGPPAGLQRDGQELALNLARHQCEQSLAISIQKRTSATADEADRQAEQRCGFLLEGAPNTVTIVTPHDI
jgi:hypothetical protein